MKPIFDYLATLGIGEGLIAGGLVIFGLAIWKSAKLSPIMQAGALGISAFAILFGAGYLVCGLL